MRLDSFSNPVFDQNDLYNALYRGYKLSSDMFVDESAETLELKLTANLKFWSPLDNYDLSVEDYDAAMQADWHMPDTYKNMDIVEFVVNQCPPENLDRVVDELDAFDSRNMFNLLRWLKFFVDTCTEKNIVWGIGRGSSVASYVLYLIGVHSIDSVKYNLDWQEFLR